MCLCVRRYPLLFWLQGLQANIGAMMVWRGWGRGNAISPEGWLVRACACHSMQHHGYISLLCNLSPCRLQRRKLL